MMDDEGEWDGDGKPSLLGCLMLLILIGVVWTPLS
jgi:hypothetical protein